jgi:F-type H+-transporting ATPase subunit epsilon
MAKLRVEIVTAERQLLAEDDVDMVVAPGSEGTLGILPKHAALLTLLSPGVLRIKKNGQESEMAVGGGFLQVNRDRVLVLADTAEREDEIDETRAQEARDSAAAALQDATRGGTPIQIQAARIALSRSMARLTVVRHRRRRMPGS